ncbi:MAG: hypothetical protein HYR84_11425 [Planctomycetes bacterium]|nr:hypothetical protein [Planctomycetota bacterium]
MANSQSTVGKYDSNPKPAATPSWIVIAAVAVALIGVFVIGVVGVGLYFAFRGPGRTEQQLARSDGKADSPKSDVAPKKSAEKLVRKQGARTETPGRKDIDDDDDGSRFSPDPVLTRTRKDDATALENPKIPSGHPDSEVKDKPPPKQALIAPLILDKEISERVIKAGGKIGKVTVSLAWNNRNDLDLHVVTSSGEKIYYAHPRSRCGGQLDVDQNVSPTTMKPVENIYWPANSPPRGPIKIYVHHYRNHGLPDCKDPTPFVVRVQIDDEVRHFNGSVSYTGSRLAFVAEIPIGADGTVNLKK